MRTSAMVPATLAGLLLLLGSADVAAEGKIRTPSPSKTLQDTYKNFLKAQSYRAKISVEGGVTESRVHALWRRTVNDTYIGSTFGGVMEVSNPKAFRTRKGGAIRKDGKWKSLLAARDGARMHRLFIWPQTIMQRALRHKASAEWIDSNKSKKKKKPRRSSTTKKSSGRTVVAEKDDQGMYFPGTVRVDVPTREALQHVIEVENSGCLSGG